PAVVPQLIERLHYDALDIVSAARKLGEAMEPTALSPIRERLSKIGNRLSNVVIGRQMKDPLTGFFVIRRDAFMKITPLLSGPGFKLLLDNLHSEKALRHPELPFDFGRRMAGESKLDTYVPWQYATFLLSKMTKGVVPASLISFLVVGASGLFVHF